MRMPRRLRRLPEMQVNQSPERKRRVKLDPALTLGPLIRTAGRCVTALRRVQNRDVNFIRVGIALIVLHRDPEAQSFRVGDIGGDEDWLSGRA